MFLGRLVIFFVSVRLKCKLTDWALEINLLSGLALMLMPIQFWFRKSLYNLRQFLSRAIPSYFLARRYTFYRTNIARNLLWIIRFILNITFLAPLLVQTIMKLLRWYFSSLLFTPLFFIWTRRRFVFLYLCFIELFLSLV